MRYCSVGRSRAVTIKRWANGQRESVIPIRYHYQTTHYTHGGPHNRSRMVAVPNLGAMAGLSFRYANAKVSFGYRIDEFFGAMDGGIDARKNYNFGFPAPS